MSIPTSRARAAIPVLASLTGSPPPAGGGSPPPGPPMVCQSLSPVFTLTPGQHHPDDPINYGTSQGLKLWYATTNLLLRELALSWERICAASEMIHLDKF